LLPSGSITLSSGVPPGRVDWNTICPLCGAVCDAVFGPVPLLHAAASSASRTSAILRVVFIGPPPLSIVETPQERAPASGLRQSGARASPRRNRSVTGGVTAISRGFLPHGTTTAEARDRSTSTRTAPRAARVAPRSQRRTGSECRRKSARARPRSPSRPGCRSSPGRRAQNPGGRTAVAAVRGRVRR